MRVALLAHHCPARDAIGRQTVAKLTCLRDHGAEVRLFVESAHHLHPTALPYCQVVSPTRPDAEVWGYLTSADLVIAEYGHAYALLNWLPLLAGSRARLILDYHGVTPAELWSGPYRETLREGARQRGLVWCADAAIVHSRFAQRELTAATAFPAACLHRLDYPLDSAMGSTHQPPFSRESQASADAALACGSRLNKVSNWSLRSMGLEAVTVLLFVGRVAPNKGVPILVEAVARLRERQPPIHAVIIGDQTGVYAAEADKCRRLALELNVADRLHFLGQVDENALVDAYHSADMLVIPSRHEGYCLPVIEAMACGLPVLTARAAALPEAVGDAGLSFRADDPDDLARQVKRVLDQDQTIAVADTNRPLKIAIVSFRYGTDIVGGAETSLRTIAESLHHAGHDVEVFTTCTRSESNWRNDHPPGTTQHEGIPIHRFPLDSHDRAGHLEAVRQIQLHDGKVSPEIEDAYLRHSIHSTALVTVLRQRLAEWDAVIVGPYLFGLTYAVAQACPDKTLLLPCFHDEAVARLSCWGAYEQVGGILYHSPEEQEYAQGVLGINHPRAFQVGTYLDLSQAGDATLGHSLGSERYLVYAGRYSQQKELPRLLEYAQRYQAERPGRFRFVFLGQGEVAIPRQPWACDLGRVEEERKRAILAGADALLQLSRQESLSLVVLEAWGQGTPVIVNKSCEVLVGQLARSGGGAAVETYAEFAQALDHLWDHPQTWRHMGQQGQAYVQTHYGAKPEFTARLANAIHSLRLPLGEQMRRRGLARATQKQQAAWRDRFRQLIDQVLATPPRPHIEQVQLQCRQSQCVVPPGRVMQLLSLRVTNQGTRALVHKGPGQTRLRCQVHAAAGSPLGPPAAVPLPALVMPGQSATLSCPVPMPAQEGEYKILFTLERSTMDDTGNQHWQPIAAEASLPLRVSADDVSSASLGGPILAEVQEALLHAHRQQTLPEDYVDVTTGRFAFWKKHIKQKLLHNFKRAYVEVLARQQSEFNRQLLAAVRDLTECCATLDHAVRQLDERLRRLEK